MISGHQVGAVIIFWQSDFYTSVIYSSKIIESSIDLFDSVLAKIASEIYNKYNLTALQRYFKWPKIT